MVVNANTVSLEMLDDDLMALVEAGGYDTERELIRQALEVFLDANPALRLEMAITLWRQDKVTLSRAAEIAQSDRETFKEELAARGLSVIIDIDAEEILKGEDKISRLRRDS